MIPKKVHYVYVSADNLRQLETEFSDGISSHLPDWDSSNSIVTISPGAVNVTFFIYRRAHIMMSHGVADKNYLLRPDPMGGLEINKYRVVCVPGDWMKRKLLATEGVRLKAHQIKVVGWPRIDKLIEAQRCLPLKTTQLSTNPKQIKVLWAPTHGSEGVAEPVSSYPAFLPYEKELSQIFDFRASLHPNVRPSKTPTFEQLLDADVVIADRGTMVYEAWALGKPVIFPTWLIGKGNVSRNKGSAENYIYKEKIGLHASSFEEMLGMIMTAKAPDKRVTDFMEDYLPSRTLGKSYELISDAVNEIWDSKNLKIKKKVKLPAAEE